MKNYILALFYVITLILTGCGTPEGDGPGHRPQEVMFDHDDEVELGNVVYNIAMEHNKRLPDDGERTKRVRRVGNKLIETLKIEPLMREMNLTKVDPRYQRLYEWKFIV